MFVNHLIQNTYIWEATDSRTNKNYLIHLNQYDPTAGIFSGFTICEVFLTDEDLEHDYLVGVFHKAFLHGEMTETQQNAELQRLFEESFIDAVEKFERIAKEIYD